MSPRTRPIRPIAAGITILTLCIPYTAATPIAAPVPASGYITGGGFAVEVDNSTYSHATVSNNVPTEYVVLHQRFAPGFIVLSYLIAVIGSLCTLELLIRRTSNAGWRNKLLLSSAGICFGAVSTFSMHFVFNNALTLSHPEIQHGENLALIYAPGYTVLSLVASCFAMTLAFFVMGTSVGEWYCVPGSRARRERRKQDAKRTGDEYRRWKTYQAQAHKGEAGEAVKKGTEKLSALMRRAGQVAKWSMMEHGLPGNDDIYANQSERDFRGTGLPKNKAKDFDPTNDKVQLDPPSLSDGILTNKRSSMSLPRGLMDGPGYNVNATWSTTGTNASTCMVGPGHSAQPSVTDGAEVFAPNYNFPPRPDSAASLIVRTTPSPTNGPESAMPTTAAQPWTRRQSIAIDNSAHAPIIATDFAQRRASLPAITPVSAPLGSERERAGRAGDTYMNTLSRIQSLPEVEQPHPNPVALSPKVMLSPEYELEKGDLFSPKQATLSISHHSRDADSELRRKRLKQDKLYGALERFLGFDVVTMEDIWKIVLTGTIAGCGVAGMHYIGQLSIIGMPYIAYDPGYVVGSVVIACGAVVVALYIMFIMLRPKLKHHFLYKLCVAFILAIAVCCMHFCGMMGTTYAWPVDQPITRHDLLKGTNGAIVGIVSALAFTACLACGVFFLIEALKARRERKRRRRVVVAAIMLDEYDRVLVNSTDGLPPMCDIASLSGNDMKSSKSTAITPTANGTGTAGGTGTEAASTLIGMDLSPGHEAFISALKLSWFWRNPEYSPTLSTLNHDAQVPVSVDATLNEIRRGSFQTATTSMTSVSRPTKVTVTKFLEKFVISSGQLATRLTGHSEGIQRIGVLYDQILTTGWVKLHNSSDTVSKGQLIILVRRVTSQIERDDLLTRHFIFADSSAVAVSLQKTLSVPLDHVNPLLQDVKLFCDSTARVSLQPGTLYAGVAIVQATPFDGLRILLEQDNRSQLPMRELCTFAANPGTQGLRPDELGGTVEEIGEALTWLEGMSLVSIINRNMTAWRNANSSSNLKVNGTTLNAGGGAVGIGGPRVTALLGALERAIVPMLDEMLSAADMEHVIPRLSLHPVLVPLTPGTPRPDPRNTYVPPYAIVLYAHYDAAVNTFTDKWLPFNLFRAQNACVMARSIGVAAKLEEELRQSQMAQAQLHAQSQVQGQGSQGYSGANPYSLAPSAYTFGSLPPMSTASARQMGSPTHGQVTAIQAEAGAGWSRRPSKVQFEDEVEQIGAAPPLTPLSMGAALASTPGAGPSSPTGLSSGFVFPPPSSRPGDMASSGGHTEASTPRGGGSANAPVPRRSSLAKTTFQSPGEHLYPSNANARGNGYQPYTSSPLQQQLRLGQSQLPIPAEIQHERWGEHERVPGVAPWEADWLLVLLRTKLRPDM